MKEILAIILLTLGISNIRAQGISTEKGNYSIDAGIGYVINKDFKSFSYNLSTSILGVVDVGLNYVGTVPNNTIGSNSYINYFVKKDSLYGVELNLAFVNLNNALAMLAGISIYGKLDLTNKFPFNFVPRISVGYLTTKDIALRFGLSIEKKINKKFSIVFTPAINKIIESQIILGLEFIYQF